MIQLNQLNHNNNFRPRAFNPKCWTNKNSKPHRTRPIFKWEDPFLEFPNPRLNRFRFEISQEKTEPVQSANTREKAQNHKRLLLFFRRPCCLRQSPKDNFPSFDSFQIPTWPLDKLRVAKGPAAHGVHEVNFIHVPTNDVAPGWDASSMCVACWDHGIQDLSGHQQRDCEDWKASTVNKINCGYQFSQVLSGQRSPNM